MDDIVAFRVESNSKEYFYLTWGRLASSVDSSVQEKKILAGLKRNGIEDVRNIYFFDSLIEVSNEKYFFEIFFQMAQKRIPFGKKYENWRKQMLKKLGAGKELYLVGERDR